MKKMRDYLLCCIVILCAISIDQICGGRGSGRISSGGGSRRTGSYSRPSSSHNWGSSSGTHHVSTSNTHTNSHPSPSIGWNPPASHGSSGTTIHKDTSHPVGSHPPSGGSNTQHTNQRPIGWDTSGISKTHANPSHASAPTSNSNHASSVPNPRPVGWDTSPSKTQTNPVGSQPSPGWGNPAFQNNGAGASNAGIAKTHTNPVGSQPSPGWGNPAFQNNGAGASNAGIPKTQTNPVGSQPTHVNTPGWGTTNHQPSAPAHVNPAGSSGNAWGNPAVIGGSGNPRPTGWDTGANKAHANSVGSNPSWGGNHGVSGTGTTNTRPIGWDTGSHGNPGGTINKNTNHPVGSSPHVDYNNNKNIGWDIPQKPGQAYRTNSYPHQQSAGVPPGGHYQQSGYHYPQNQGHYTGPTKVKIVNKYNYNYPGYYSVPQPSYYPGYYHVPSYYHYSSHDTGSGALGFFLGYSLAKMTTPTYSHYSFFDGYRPRYDHYEVHHYYHNRDAIPQRQEIPSNNIIGCIGDAPTVCPQNTVSLCTSSGALMCVVSAARTTQCTTAQGARCVTTEISCVNNTAPECAGQKNNLNATAKIDVPCISDAKIAGNITFVNNTILPANLTAAAATNLNLSPGINGSTSTLAPTTTPASVIGETTTMGTIAPQRQKRNTDANIIQNFCVTIVALPAKKKETEGEQFFNGAGEIFSKFVEKAWGL